MPPIDEWFRFEYVDPEGVEDAGLTEEDLARFEAAVVNDPEIGDPMSGTGGLRKVRLAPEGRGKSGGWRVCYFLYRAYGVVIVPLVFPKSQKENLTAAEKKYFRRLAAVYEDVLARRTSRRS